MPDHSLLRLLLTLTVLFGGPPVVNMIRSIRELLKGLVSIQGTQTHSKRQGPSKLYISINLEIKDIFLWDCIEQVNRPRQLNGSRSRFRSRFLEQFLSMANWRQTNDTPRSKLLPFSHGINGLTLQRINPRMCPNPSNLTVSRGLHSPT